jgi:hypothetical protein
MYSGQSGKRILRCRPFRKTSGEQVKYLEECRLPAGRNRQVLRADLPAERLPQELRQRRQKTRIPLRRVVVPQHAVEAGPVIEQSLHPLPPDFLHRGHSCGIATTEHEHVGLDRHRPPQVIHQRQDTAAGGELLTNI